MRWWVLVLVALSLVPPIVVLAGGATAYVHLADNDVEGGAVTLSGTHVELSDGDLLETCRIWPWAAFAIAAAGLRGDVAGGGDRLAMDVQLLGRWRHEMACGSSDAVKTVRLRVESGKRQCVTMHLRH
jgi:hypothetical protein